MNSKEYAEEVEHLVEFALVSKGYLPVCSNMEIAGVEVDRVFQDLDGDWIVCEIKAISDWKYLDVRVRPFQKRRLELARDWLQAYRAPGDVYIQYAYAHYNEGEVRVYDSEGDEVFVISDLVHEVEY